MSRSLHTSGDGPARVCRHRKRALPESADFRKVFSRSLQTSGKRSPSPHPRPSRTRDPRPWARLAPWDIHPKESGSISSLEELAGPKQFTRRPLERQRKQYYRGTSAHKSRERTGRA
eukprot:gene15277-biopygen640